MCGTGASPIPRHTSVQAWPSRRRIAASISNQFGFSSSLASESLGPSSRVTRSDLISIIAVCFLKAAELGIAILRRQREMAGESMPQFHKVVVGIGFTDNHPTAAEFGRQAEIANRAAVGRRTAIDSDVGFDKSQAGAHLSACCDRGELNVAQIG